MDKSLIKDQVKLFRKFTNSCVCNVKAAMNIYGIKNEPADSLVLAYICQAHACAKQIQLMAAILDTKEYDVFYNAFIVFNTTFMRVAVTGQDADKIDNKYNLFLEAFSKLTFIDD
ncbi:hypothetical protein [Pectinatus frisingensis]|jgi:hypothetical protein|uniref:hypothetical protein n=1 Tax=Pectinatus frisingensis TaxID=865 RepID=UPI0015F50BB5|nr:hypothetical protein [Pectinatus frisingensis]